MRLTASHIHVLTALLATLLLFGGVYADQLARESVEAELRAKTQQQLAQVRSQLEGTLASDIQLVRGLLGVIALEPNLTQARFERVAAPLFAGRTLLRNIAVAPNMVIRLIYPVLGNEKAIGLDYRQVPSQFASVDRARQEREIVIAGPLTLVQGGTGIIARVPVYLDGENGRPENFWGIVSAVIDADRLYAASGLNDPAAPIDIVIRGRNATGAEGEVFFGRPELLVQAPVLGDIQLPGGRWQIGAVPKGGWTAHAATPWKQRSGFLMAGVLIIGAFIALSRSLRAESAALAQAEAASQSKSRDINERERIQLALSASLNDKEALLKEVHHRVKNNLQVIASLLRLESRRSTVENTKAVLGDMQARIRAMALLHESLYRSGTFASVDLGSYLRQLAKQAFQAQSLHLGAVRLDLNLGSVQVGMDQAIPCGLLINELISNCMKHGFPDGVVGTISIDLQPLDVPQQWCLHVSDSGVGLPEDFEEKRKNSLGLQLVGDLARQIGGELKITPNQDKGVVFTVNFQAIEPAPLVMPA